jgi:hypothetical protein
VLAIGDSVKTELKGAAAFGVDCLFVISGLHSDQFGLREVPDVAGVFAATDARAQVGHSPTEVVIVRLIFEHHCVRVLGRDGHLPASFLRGIECSRTSFWQCRFSGVRNRAMACPGRHRLK